MRKRLAAALITAALLPLGSSADIIWSGLTNWVSITVAGQIYNDPKDQSPGSVDLIGNSVDAAGFWQYSEGAIPADDILAFRLRVSDLPNNPQKRMADPV